MENILELASCFVCHDIPFDQEYKKKIIKSGQKFMNNLLTKYVNQNPIYPTEQSTFVYDISDLTFSVKENILTEKEKPTAIDIVMYDTSFIMMTPSLVDLAETILLSKNNYLFLYGHYLLNNKSSTHAVMFYFDLHNKKIYLCDPNGFSTYFDQYIENSSEYVDGLLYNFVEQLNKLGFDFKYVPQLEWMNKDHYINRNINIQNTIDSGNCYLNSFLIAYFISVGGLKLDEIYKMFSDLTDHEYAYFMSNLTTFIYYENIDLFTT